MKSRIPPSWRRPASWRHPELETSGEASLRHPELEERVDFGRPGGRTGASAAPRLDSDFEDGLDTRPGIVVL